MLSFRFLLMMNTFCFKNHPFSNKLAPHFRNEDTIEILAVRCLSICQFKIGRGEYTRKKWIAPFPPCPSTRARKKWYSKRYENGEMAGVKKLVGTLAPYERIGPIRVVGFRTRGTINPGGFAMEFLRSWSELGVALRLELRFDLSPTASHATAITHRPLISIFRPARALFDHPFPPRPPPPPSPSSPLLPLLLHRDRRYSDTCLRYSMLLRTSDLDPIDRHELIVPQILPHLCFPSLR